jgi:hypothetical protein
MKKNARIKSKSVYLFFLFLIICNYSRCQLLSCTTEKAGKKKNRKNRLRSFPNKWNELSKEHRDEIRRLLRKPLFLLEK